MIDLRISVAEKCFELVDEVLSPLEIRPACLILGVFVDLAEKQVAEANFERVFLFEGGLLLHGFLPLSLGLALVLDGAEVRVDSLGRALPRQHG